jgi:hypothetical protein
MPTEVGSGKVYLSDPNGKLVRLMVQDRWDVSDFCRPLNDLLRSVLGVYLEVQVDKFILAGGESRKNPGRPKKLI